VTYVAYIGSRTPFKVALSFFMALES
jgi:hypothetical protein